MNKYIKPLLAATAVTYCAFGFSAEQSSDDDQTPAHQQSLVYECANTVGFVTGESNAQTEELNIVTLEVGQGNYPLPIDTPLLTRIKECIKHEISMSEISQSDREFLEQYQTKQDNFQREYEYEGTSLTKVELYKKYGLTEAEDERKSRIETELSAIKEQRAEKLAADLYFIDEKKDLIIDKSKKIHFKLSSVKPETMTQEDICADLEKGSTDYKWCMGEITGTPPSECKNSYGDKCGTKYEKRGTGYYKMD